MPPETSSATQSIRRSLYQVCAYFTVFIPIVCVILPHFSGIEQDINVVVGAVFASVASFLIFVHYRHTKRLVLACNLQSAILTIGMILSVATNGGVAAPTITFAPLIVIIVGLLGGKRAMMASASSMILGVVFLGLLGANLSESPLQLSRKMSGVINTAVSLTAVAILILLYERLRAEQERQLRSFAASLKVEQHRIRARTRFLEAVLENIPSMIFVKDYKNGLRFSLLNRAGEEILGMPAESILGRSDHDFFPKEQAEFFTEIDKAVFAKGEVVKILQEPIATTNGQKILSTLKVPTFDEDGNPEFLIGISNDITQELKTKTELELERAKAMHAGKLASLGELSAGFAHEINNPLTVIHGNVRLLPRYIAKPEAFEKSLAAINSAVTRISKIVAGLRKFSRSADLVQHRSIKLTDLIKEAIVLTDAKARRHEVVVTVQDESEAVIDCNEIEIEQVLINLINNGIDAAKELPERWVKIEVSSIGEEIRLRVTDSGHGISPEVKEKLFQPFFTTKPVGEGTGLGLAIVKGILDQHNATITIDGLSDRTCFELSFRRSSEAKHAA